MNNGTNFSKIFEIFLSKITDSYLASLVPEDLEAELLPILVSAIQSFCRVSEHDLHARNDDAMAFDEELSEDEMEVLAVYMLPIWIQQQINSSRFIMQQYYDAGIKTYSPNETMRNLQTLYTRYRKDARNAHTEYTKKIVDIGNFGGR